MHSTHLTAYRQCRRSAADAVALVRDGDSSIVPTGVGEPPALLAALSDRRRSLHGVRVSQILAMRRRSDSAASRAGGSPTPVGTMMLSPSRTRATASAAERRHCL